MQKDSSKLLLNPPGMVHLTMPNLCLFVALGDCEQTQSTYDKACSKWVWRLDEDWDTTQTVSQAQRAGLNQEGYKYNK